MELYEYEDLMRLKSWSADAVVAAQLQKKPAERDAWLRAQLPANPTEFWQGSSMWNSTSVGNAAAIVDALPPTSELRRAWEQVYLFMWLCIAWYTDLFRASGENRLPNLISFAPPDISFAPPEFTKLAQKKLSKSAWEKRREAFQRQIIAIVAAVQKVRPPTKPSKARKTPQKPPRAQPPTPKPPKSPANPRPPKKPSKARKTPQKPPQRTR